MAAARARHKPQQQESWDTDEGALHSAVENPGAVVTVRFTSEEYQRLSRAARRSGMRTTQYIHEAALAHVAEQDPAASPEQPELAKP